MNFNMTRCKFDTFNVAECHFFQFKNIKSLYFKKIQIFLVFAVFGIGGKLKNVFFANGN